MKISTSYFGKSGSNPNSISISRGTPKWFTGHRYIDLAPPWYVIKMNDEADYVKAYTGILEKLDAEKVIADLLALTETPILLCYEKPPEFCHRRLVADWIEAKTGIVVEEI